MMPKRDTIEVIRSYNPTATTEFLSEFSTDELSEYLGRLKKHAKCSPFEDERFAVDPSESDLDARPDSPSRA